MKWEPGNRDQTRTLIYGSRASTEPNAGSLATLLLVSHNELQRFTLGDHRQQSRVLLTVKWRRGRRSLVATHLLLFSRRVEPEAHVEGVDRSERVSRVHDEGLFVEDALDIDLGMAK